MHIEKYICESLVGTLLNINGKTKDGVNSRRDLQALGIRHELHVKECGNRLFLPATPHMLSKVLKGYVRNRARQEGCIAECYLADECMQFCSKYLPQIADVGNKDDRNQDVVYGSVVE
ncbi:hypothetical protein Ddye_011110 [Dipteronia dyeriana]|uniref:DUF4218 domain-containing protein n=1 Tax=Dipteronia dyeriana TaxID=168575 RepID=A0AAD9XFF7_9ROSI|nr:hypothetical protein Ddye_011110 [Dipteronia dyeriana]